MVNIATKKIIKTILKELKLTEEDMQRFWDECKEVNRLVKLLSDNDKNWTDLTESQIRQLPTLKEETLRKQSEKEKEDEEKRLAEEKKKQEEDYYWKHFEEIMVQKIDSGEKLTEKELKTLIFECHEVERDEGENRRWTRSISSIIELCGRYFCVVWEKGLTECQENEFWEQPYEVKKHTYEKTISVTEWEKIK